MDGHRQPFKWVRLHRASRPAGIRCARLRHLLLQREAGPGAGARRGPHDQLPPDGELGCVGLQRTSGRGVDHVVEVGGPGTLPQSIEACRIGGHISLNRPTSVRAGFRLSPRLVCGLIARAGFSTGHKALFSVAFWLAPSSSSSVTRRPGCRRGRLRCQLGQKSLEGISTFDRSLDGADHLLLNAGQKWPLWKLPRSTTGRGSVSHRRFGLPSQGGRPPPQAARPAHSRARKRRSSTGPGACRGGPRWQASPRRTPWPRESSS
jgi:hypothetical protein